MDDNFSSIVGAIRMGRRIFDNLQKSFGYIFAIHVPIAGLSLLPILVNDLPIILWPVHIVFLELIIDPACSIIFEAEKEESNVMDRPPKKLDEPFFGSRKILLSCLQGFFILIEIAIVYFVCLHVGFDVKEVRAMAFTTLIISNIAVILTNRSWSENIFKIIATPNKAVLWVVGGAVFFLTLILNIPFFLNLFQFRQLSIINILICIGTGMTTIIWFEFYKLYNRKKQAVL
jgi:Ca2+-transporting ATPase